MSIMGFNLGIDLSLGDMELALNYINDKEEFEPDLGIIKQSELQHGAQRSSLYEAPIAVEEYTSIDPIDTVDIEGELDDEELDDEELEDSIDNLEDDELDEDELYGDGTDEDSDEDSDEDAYDEDEMEECLGDDDDDNEPPPVQSKPVVTQRQNTVEQRGNIAATLSPAVLNQPSITSTSGGQTAQVQPQSNKNKELREKLERTRLAREEAERQLEEDIELEQLIAEEERKKRDAEALAQSRREAISRKQAAEEQQRMAAHRASLADAPRKSPAPIQDTAAQPQQRPRHPTEVIAPKVTRDTGTIHDNRSNMVANIVNRDNDRIAKTHTDEYSSLDIEGLFKLVKEFMLQSGVQKQQVELKALEAKFGKLNITKLITKSYLIITRRGVTIGR